jgi:glutathione synthase/RimK-type ligase-like ATP-grasp enzyme
MIGLVTYGKYPDLTDDDRPLLRALEAIGLDAAPVVWDKPGIGWPEYDTLVLRSTWNYHLKPREFTAWVGAVEARGARLWNSPAVVGWNMHKRYLRDLEKQGVAIPPTEWVARGDPRPLRTLLGERGWTDAIVKPAISASATDTWRTTGDVIEDDWKFSEVSRRRDVLVQPVLPEVAAAGEWSVMYVDGAFSHAMLKRPRAGDFRVQAEHGGTATRAEPPRALVGAADRIVACIPGDWLYARVDGVETARGFVLMELELIEPVLFLSESEGAVDRLATAIARKASRP